MPESENLAGGYNTDIRLEGNTVVRSAGAHSSGVHSLLRHLREQGVHEVPAPVALGAGSEHLAYIPGQAGTYPLQPRLQSQHLLSGFGRLLRRVHDASVTFVEPADAAWRYRGIRPIDAQVMCHNDLGPYNVVFGTDAPIGIIDWDFAAPGPRVWDLAYAAYRFVPLSQPTQAEALGWGPVDVPRRLSALLDAYGASRDVRFQLVDFAIVRLESLIIHIEAGIAKRDPAFARQAAEDHPGSYRAEVAYLTVMRDSWLEAAMGAVGD